MRHALSRLRRSLVGLNARKNHLSRKHFLLFLVTTLGLVGAAGWLAIASGAFGVHTVSVAGVQRLSTQTVVDAASISRGASLLTLDTDDVERRIGRLPAVRDVVVERHWPGTLHVTVREREVAALRRHGRTYHLLDRTGVAFATVRKRPRGLPLVPATEPERLRASLSVLPHLPDEVAGQVVEIRADGPEEVTVRLTGNRRVVWGSPDRGARKGRVLAALVTRKAQVYDVSAPDNPVTRK